MNSVPGQAAMACCQLATPPAKPGQPWPRPNNEKSSITPLTHLTQVFSLPGKLNAPLTMIASSEIAHGLYLFVLLLYDFFQKVCNFLGSCSAPSNAAY
jgi:hypothetical protein